MTDIFSKSKRSQVMSANKGFGNKTTDLSFKKILRTYKISGWRTHYGKLPGRPDFVFLKKRVAVFLDGCFWHGCTKCSRNLKPSSNTKFWMDKAIYNKEHDRKVNALLRKKGWKILRLWEHEIQKEAKKCVRRLRTTYD